MASFNITSLEDTIVPSAYIEEVVVNYDTSFALGVNNKQGTRYIDKYGNEKFSVSPLASGEQVPERNLALDVKMFLMLTEKVYRDLSDSKELKSHILVADTNKKINLLRGGEYSFAEIQNLISQKELYHQTVSFASVEERAEKVMLDGKTFYRLPYEASIVLEEAKNVAVFAFTTAQDLNSRTLNSKGQLYGRLTGEIVLLDGTVPNEYYYFSDTDNQIWAGSVHSGTQAGTYSAGLKEISGQNEALVAQKTSVYKVFDRRSVDIEQLFEEVKDEFSFEAEAKVFEDTKTSEKLTFAAKTSGLSPIMSSIVRKERTKVSNVPVRYVSNLMFIDAEQILRENSRYASLLDRLDDNEFNYALRSTTLDFVEISRTSIYRSEENDQTIINTSFRPGESNAKSQTNNVANSLISGGNSFTTFAYLEEEDSNSYGLPMKKFKALTFVDEVPTSLRKSDFYYTVRLQIADGIGKFIESRIDTVREKLLAFKSLYAKLSNPTFSDTEGNFNARAKSKQDDAKLVEVLSEMVSAMSFFFDLSDKTTASNLLNATYFASNTETGNIYEMDKAYRTYEKLYSFLVDQFSYGAESAGNLNIEASSASGKFKNIELEKISNIINLNFDRAVGLKFIDTYNPMYNREGISGKMPLFLPAVSRRVLKSDTRVDTSLSNPDTTDTFLTYYNLHSVLLDRDYLIRKAAFSDTMGNNADYIEYLSILLNDSIKKSKHQIYVGELPYSTTKKKNAKKVKLGERNRNYECYIGLLESLATLGISMDANIIAESLDDGRFEVSNSEQKSRFVDLDFVSSKIPSMISKIVQKSYINENALGILPDNVANPFTSLVNASAGQIPFQFTSLGTNSSNVLGNDKVVFANDKFSLLDKDVLSYYYYNYATLGTVKVIVDFEQGSMTPIYRELTAEELNEQNLGRNTKYICKVDMYSNPRLLTNIFTGLDTKILEQHFAVIQGAPIQEKLDQSDLINENNIEAPRVPQVSNTVAAAIEDLSRINSVGFNIYEKYFSSSLFVKQPVEVTELRFEFDRSK
jgi:hypothetical protein